MLLDDGTGKEPRAKAITMRFRTSVDEYLRKRGAVRRDGMTGLIEGSLRLHQAFSETFTGNAKFSVQQFALDEGLDIEKQEPEIYARLALRGLKDAEKHRK